MLRRVVALLGIMTVACSGDADPGDARCDGCLRCDAFSAPTPEGVCAPVGLLAEHCASGFRYDEAAHTCEPVLPTAECAPGTMASLGSSECVAVGVPKCASGFARDGAGGCKPQLPPSRCGEGRFAVPGEGSCHAVSTCGAGTWGDGPFPAGTLYVDGAFAGGGADGSASRPFTTVQAALDVAPVNGTIAVAAGTYVEDLSIRAPLTLVGRCAELVTLKGKSATGPAIDIAPSGAVTVRGVAVTGPGPGVHVANAVVTLENLWVHDTGGRGINALLSPTVAQLVLRDSLVERATEVGVMVFGAKATLERVAVRKTVAGRGIVMDGDGGSKRRSTVTITQSIVEDLLDNAIAVFGSAAVVERTVIRGVHGTSLGVGVYAETVDGLAAQVTVTDSFVEECTTAGVALFGATGSIARSTILDTAPAADGSQGFGVAAHAKPTPFHASDLTLRDSLLARNHTANVSIVQSTAHVEGSVLRDGLTQPETKTAGFGVVVEPPKKGPSELTLVRSLIEGSREAGLAVFGGKATVSGTSIRDTRPRESDGLIGRGLDVSVTEGHVPELVLNDSIVEKNEETGITIHGGIARISGVLVRDTAPTSARIGDLGYGLTATVDEASGVRADVEIRSSVFERNHTAGIAFAAADALVFGTLVRDTLPSIARDAYGVGIAVSFSPGLGGSVARIESSLLLRNRFDGLNVTSAKAEMIASIIADTRPAGALYGDAVTVDTYVPELPARLDVSRSVLSGSARAAFSTFGSTVSIASSVLECNPLDIDYEKRAIDALSLDAKLEDRGGNQCGCGASRRLCKAGSNALAPVEPLVLPEH